MIREFSQGGRVLGVQDAWVRRAQPTLRFRVLSIGRKEKRPPNMEAAFSSRDDGSADNHGVPVIPIAIVTIALMVAIPAVVMAAVPVTVLFDDHHLTGV